MIQSHTRPGRFRPVLTMILITIVLVLGWLGLEVYFALTAQPNPTIDFGERAEELVLANQLDPKAENIWPLLLETIELFESSQIGLVDDDTGIEWSAYTFDVVFAYDGYLESMTENEAQTLAPDERGQSSLDAHRRMAIKALATWDDLGITRRLDGIALGQCAVRPLPDSTQTMLLEILLPELGAQRSLARALRARMWLALEAGDWQEYARALEQGLAIGRLGMSQSTLIDRLVGIAIRSLMLGQVSEDLGDRGLPLEACELVDQAIDRQSALAPITHAFNCEYLMHLDVIQWTHDQRGRILLDRVGMLDGTMGSLPRIANVASIVLPRKHTTERWFMDYNKQLTAYTKLSPAQRAERSRQGIDLGIEPGNGLGMALQSMLVPAYQSSILADDRMMLDELGIRVMLAIEQCRLASGSLPDSLEELTPRWLAKPATDPYSPDGELLRYRVLEEPDELGRAYILYSIGHDAQDNGAAPTSPQKADALKPGYPGTDYIINQP